LRRTSVILVIAGAFILTAITASQAQNASSLLAKADSLFAQKKYTEAYTTYLDLFQNRRLSSPEMLIKMAFINEGMGDYSMALYFLNLYYLESPDKAVLKKMEELARQHRLTGYEFDDFNILENLYHQYAFHIMAALAAMTVLLLAFMFRMKTGKKQIPASLTVAYSAVLVLLLLTVNFGSTPSKGIITSEHAFMMDSPSAASGVVEVARQGHRVKILGEKDVWLKIKWNGRNAYIRKKNVAQLF